MSSSAFFELQDTVQGGLNAKILGRMIVYKSERTSLLISGLMNGGKIDMQSQDFVYQVCRLCTPGFTSPTLPSVTQSNPALWSRSADYSLQFLVTNISKEYPALVA